MRHERTLDVEQRSPDGTWTAIRLHESYDDDPAPPAPLGLPRRTETARRTPYVVGATAALVAVVAAGVPVLAQVVLP